MGGMGGSLLDEKGSYLMIIYGENGDFTQEFLRENSMGPNPLRMLEELLTQQPISPGARVLDLGCGRGITSMYLAKVCKARVFALDLWIQAAENYQRFLAAGLGDAIVPLHGDANALPFAQEYFDTLVCVDAYHYFGRTPGVMDEKIAPFVKPGGHILLAIPGMVRDIHGDIPAAMLRSWSPEDLDTIHDAQWWGRLLAGEHWVKVERIWPMACYEQAWAEWLACDNPYAIGDRAAMEAGASQYMNLLGIVLKRI